jgi:hypothetical protein
MSSFLKLDRSDLWKGLVVAVLGAVLGALQQGLTAHGLDLAAYDWSLVIDIAVSAAGAYLSKNLFSTADGHFLGMVKL